MRTIHKHKLSFERPITVTLPEDAIPVHVGVQNREVYVWIEFDPEATVTLTADIEIFGTGHDIPADYDHCGSCFDRDYVWHVYAIAKLLPDV